MSATIGAALKKIAVALLTDKKVIKTIGGIIIGIIIILVMPIIAVVSIFNGSMDIDTDKLNQSIQENISAEQMENLQLINDTMTEVENQLKSKKLSDCNTQAEVIYLFSLSDKSKENDFVKNFVSCFKKNQSDEDLINAVNQKFEMEIKYYEFQKMMQSIKGAEISTAGFTDKTTKNNLDLVKWCENAYKNGWGYVYGGYGQVCTKQYLDGQASLFPGNNEAGGEMRQVGEKWLGKRVCDCIGLIKSYAWYNADSGEIVAGSNGFTDCGANSIWSNVTESGPISNMPETYGLAVWMDGHIGVYIGNAVSIERRLAAMKTFHDAGVCTTCFIFPIFPGVTDVEAIIERVKKQCNLIWLENLNLRGDYKKVILDYIKEKYSRLALLYEEIYQRGNRTYWEMLDARIKAYTERQGDYNLCKFIFRLLYGD